MDLVQLLEQILTHFLRYQNPLALHKDPINDCNIIDYGVLAILPGIGAQAPEILDLSFELIGSCGYRIPLPR